MKDSIVQEHTSNETRCLKCGNTVFKVERTSPEQVLLTCSKCDEPHLIDAQLDENRAVLTFWSPKMEEQEPQEVETYTIHLGNEIPGEISGKSVEDLAKEFIEFIEREFPEEKYNAMEKHKDQTLRLFWLTKGVSVFTTNPEFELKKEKVEMLVEMELEKRVMKENKELLSSLTSKIVEWAKKNELSKITKTDVDIFLMEEELILSSRLKDVLHRMANLGIRKD